MRRHFAFICAVVGMTAVPMSGAISPALAADIIDDWASVKAPPPPTLKPVTLDPKTTALLVIDVLPGNYCTDKPRCMAELPAMKQLLATARSKGAAVIYTLAGDYGAADVLKDVAPAANEPSVKSSADKFLNTDLEKILKDKSIQTVILAGTAANGGVLYTGSSAGLRGFKVIVPVDVISGADPYTEQFAVWQLANGPRFGALVTVTRSDMIKF
jgi:nicotinamidase-related amidase